MPTIVVDVTAYKLVLLFEFLFNSESSSFGIERDLSADVEWLDPLDAVMLLFELLLTLWFHSMRVLAVPDDDRVDVVFSIF